MSHEAAGDWLLVNSSLQDKMAATLADDIFERIFLKEKYVFRLIFHWSLFPRVE